MPAVPRHEVLRLAALVVAAHATFGCTTLGPMPGVTGTLPVPSSRGALEVEVAALPGYYLSSATTDDPHGASIPQARALLEVGRAFPGFAVGGRYVGNAENGGHAEPMLAYRTPLGTDRRLAAAFVWSGTAFAGSDRGAEITGARMGLEATLDLRATPVWRFVELHLVGTGALSGMAASGRYCEGEDGLGRDCVEGEHGTATAAAAGAHVAFAIGLALDGARHLGGRFHGVRLALLVGGGTMPRVERGVERGVDAWSALGLSLTVTVGAPAR